jgi:O-antigen/teichoic acid export membrane protein
MKLGIQFFVLQLAGLLLFSTANIIITQLFGPSEVTPYNIVFKYYGIASLGFSIILAPFWSAYTEAFVNRDNDWIMRSTRKLKKVWLGLLVVLVVMTAASDHVYRLWVGRDLGISLWLSVLMAVYTAIVAWSNIFVYFINATGKIRLQLWVAIIVSVLNIPLAIMLASTLGLRSVGVIAATCIALLPGCLIAPLQMKKIISGSAAGIWAR